MNKENYRWLVCLGCMIAVFSTCGLSKTGFSVYQPYLISRGGLSDSQASMLIMLHSSFSMISYLLVMKIYRKLGVRVSTALAIAGVAGSLFLYSIAESFTVYCMAAVLAGTSYGIGGLLSASILIERWFDQYMGLALGISMAGSGLSAAIGTPIITMLLEQHSLQRVFRMEGIFVMVLSVITFLLLREWPDGSPSKRIVENKVNLKEKPYGKREDFYLLSGKRKYILLLSVILLGFTSTAASYLPMLYKGGGFDSTAISFLISLMGIVLCFGKCIYGFVVDRIGDYCAGNLFYSLLIISLFLFCTWGLKDMRIACIAMVLFGLGCPTLTVGLSVVAKAVAKDIYYDVVIRQFQLVFMVGAMLYSAIPGITADITGSYILSFAILAVVTAVAAFLIQGVSHQSIGKQGIA